MIQAIPTEYNGYRFRSRLEARWALFFDLVRVPYHFELQPYRCGPSNGYLPDFFLPDYNKYVEIKPYHPKQDEIAKALDFCIKKGTEIVILCGDPYGVIAAYWYTFFHWHYVDKVTDPYQFAMNVCASAGTDPEYIDERGFAFTSVTPSITFRTPFFVRPGYVWDENKGFQWCLEGADHLFDTEGDEIAIELGVTNRWLEMALEARMYQFWSPKGNR